MDQNASYMNDALHAFYVGAGGFHGERMKNEVTWNRVANLKGKPGANLGLDLVNQFLNNDFKGNTHISIENMGYRFYMPQEAL